MTLICHWDLDGIVKVIMNRFKVLVVTTSKGVPLELESVRGSMLYNVFINDFFYFTNCADKKKFKQSNHTRNGKQKNVSGGSL